MSLPPGPPLPPAAQIALWMTRPVDLMEWCARRYGDAFTLQWPAYPRIVFVSTPEAIKQVFTADPDVVRAGEANVFLRPVLGSNSLLLLDGKEHLRERRLLLPPFHGERMHAYARVMRDVTSRAVDAWPLGTPFSLAPEMQSVTLDVIVRTVFGVERGAELAHMRAILAKWADTSNSPLLFAPPLQVDLGRYSPWGRVLVHQRATDDALFAEVARRRAAPLDARADILSMLLQARDEDGHPMTDQELRDQLLTLLAAGHETTATSLAWAFAMVLEHPAVSERLAAELRSVVGDGALEPEHLPRLVYLDALVKETLRLRPIIPIVARSLQAPMRIGGYDLPAGVQVMPCIYLAHRRAESFPDPLAFRPERFLDAKTDPYTFLPFGGGTRRCIGMAFAQYEMKIVLATVFARARLRLASARPVGFARRGISIAPKGGTRVVMESRKAAYVTGAVSAGAKPASSASSARAN